MTKAWPFLISRNEKLDFQTVAAPEALIVKGSLALLEDYAGSQDMVDGQVYCRELRNTKFGNITILFRMIQAVDNISRQPLLDDFRRELPLIEGIVIEGNANSLNIAYTDLDKIHKLVEDVFVRFWSQTDYFQPEPIKCLTLTEITIDTPQVDHIHVLAHYDAKDIQKCKIDLGDPLIPQHPSETSPEKLRIQPSRQSSRARGFLKSLFAFLSDLLSVFRRLLQNIFGQR